MQGSISIYVDRFPNYFYLPSLQGYDSKVFVAERDGDIIGVIGVSFRNVRLFGNLIKIGYTGGLKIKESAKGSRTLYRLMKRTYDEMLEKNAQLGILFALKENQKVLRIISGRVNIPKFYPIANFKVFHIFPLLKFKIKNKYEIERLSKSNLQEIEKFFLRFFKRYELVEEFNNEKVSKILKESKDFSLDNFFIARQNGRIVATISY
ncbi:MAG: GNAT family N-acetyltransferase, partial [Candidatus Aminicenantia bacterium]